MNKKYEVKSLEGETIFDKLLFSKGFQTRDEADEFLNPKYDNLHDPFLMHDMEKACVRIFEAVEANEKIVIFSDYDCDGIPGGVVLHDFFKKINYKNGLSCSNRSTISQRQTCS